MDGRPIDILPQLTVLVLACISVIFAGIHAKIINEDRGRELKKWAYVLLYSGISCLFAWLKGLHDKTDFDWWMVAAAFCVRVVFFNIPLNRFRKPPKPYFYTTPELKNVTGWKDAISKDRFWDYAMLKIFRKHLWIPYLLSLAAAIYITFFKL